jgi:hypothetical protein
MSQPVAEPVEKAAPSPGPQPVLQSGKDVQPPAQAQANDLFAGVAEDDRFEIPAFLRRQAKTGS